MNSKKKGNAGERELCAILAEAGVAHRNDQRYVAGTKYHVECKRAERFNAYEAMGQAERDANGHAVPLVVHRRNRKPWLVIMKLSDWLQLIGRK